MWGDYWVDVFFVVNLGVLEEPCGFGFEGVWGVMGVVGGLGGGAGVLEEGSVYWEGVSGFGVGG